MSVDIQYLVVWIHSVMRFAVNKRQTHLWTVNDAPSLIFFLKRMFELIGSEASYMRSLGVAVKYFFLSKALKQTLSPMEHHILFSNIHHVMAASEKWDSQYTSFFFFLIILLLVVLALLLSRCHLSSRFLMDLEIRLGESVLIGQVGDVVLRHCPEFHRLYVPYVTNMMYQEALVNQLLWVSVLYLITWLVLHNF